MTESGDTFIGVKGLTVAIARMIFPLIRLSRYDGFRPDIALEDGHGKPFWMEQFMESSQ